MKSIKSVFLLYIIILETIVEISSSDFFVTFKLFDPINIYHNPYTNASNLYSQLMVTFR